PLSALRQPHRLVRQRPDLLLAAAARPLPQVRPVHQPAVPDGGVAHRRAGGRDLPATRSHLGRTRLLRIRRHAGGALVHRSGYLALAPPDHLAAPRRRRALADLEPGPLLPRGRHRRGRRFRRVRRRRPVRGEGAQARDHGLGRRLAPRRDRRLARLARPASGGAPLGGPGRGGREPLARGAARSGRRAPGGAGAGLTRRRLGAAETCGAVRPVPRPGRARIPVLRRAPGVRLERADVPAALVTGERASLRLRLLAIVLAATLLPIAPLSIVLLLQVRDGIYGRAIADARARLVEVRDRCAAGVCPEPSGVRRLAGDCPAPTVRDGEHLVLCEPVAGGGAIELRQDVRPVRIQIAALVRRILATLALFLAVLVTLAVLLLERGLGRRLERIDAALESVGREQQGPGLLPEGG